MNLRKIKEITKPGSLTIENEVLQFEFYPHRLTAGMVSRISQGGDDATSTEEVANALESILSKWDLTNDGEVIPITAESLMEGVPFELMFLVFKEVVGQSQPTPPKPAP